MKVVAISGWKRSGKDTAAQYLIDNFDYNRVAFADALKDMVAEQYNIPRAHCDDPKFKESPLDQYPVLPKDEYSLYLSKFMVGEFRDAKGRKVHDFHIDASGAFMGVLGAEAVQLYWTPRALCILEGSVKRTVTSRYWVQKTIGKVDALDKTYGGAVISDLRYKSEIDQLRQAFGKDLITIRINRFEKSESNDPSERDLDDAKFDVVIENRESSLDNLYNKLEEVFNGT